MALVMGLSMSAPVLATEGGSDIQIPVTEDKIEMKKDIKLNNGGTVHPEETFTFKVENGKVEVTGAVGVTKPEVPDLGEFTIKVDQDEGTGTTQIDLSAFTELGVYTYDINEVDGNTAGMNYAAKDYVLKVTVLNTGTYVALENKAGEKNRYIPE